MGGDKGAGAPRHRRQPAPSTGAGLAGGPGLVRSAPAPHAAAGRSGHPLVAARRPAAGRADPAVQAVSPDVRSEEHTSELQSLMRISYAVFCLKKKTNRTRK